MHPLTVHEGSRFLKKRSPGRGVVHHEILGCRSAAARKSVVREECNVVGVSRISPRACSMVVGVERRWRTEGRLEVAGTVRLG